MGSDHGRACGSDSIRGGHIRGWLKGSDHGRAGVDLDTRYIPF